MRLEEVRAFVLSLPGVTESPHFEKSSFRVRGRIFASVPPGGEHLHVLLDDFEARAFLAEDPTAFEALRWGTRPVGVRVNLVAADPERVLELVEESWRRKAPLRLIARWESGETAIP